jgi:hypothetical protein
MSCNKSSKSKEKINNKNKVHNVELVFHENLLKSLNQIYEKQNLELLKAISEEKMIPLNDLLKFGYDQSTITIPPDE